MGYAVNNATTQARPRYNPFGELRNPGGNYNFRFPGQYADAETGLHYNYFRDYDPSTGRYIQSDPIGLGGGWNTYGYVGGNPVTRVDPRGLNVRVAGYSGGLGHVGVGVNTNETSGRYPRSGKPSFIEIVRCRDVPGQVDPDQGGDRDKGEPRWFFDIPTSSQQDDAMLRKIEELKKSPYNACKKNCEDFVQAVLAAGGIKCPPGLTPDDLRNSLRNGQCSGTPPLQPWKRAQMDR